LLKLDIIYSVAGPVSEAFFQTVWCITLSKT